MFYIPCWNQNVVQLASLTKTKSGWTTDTLFIHQQIIIHAFFPISPSRSTPARQRMDTWCLQGPPTRNWKCAVSTLDKWREIKRKTKGRVVLDLVLQSCPRNRGIIKETFLQGQFRIRRMRQWLPNSLSLSLGQDSLNGEVLGMKCTNDVTRRI